MSRSASSNDWPEGEPRSLDWADSVTSDARTAGRGVSPVPAALRASRVPTVAVAAIAFLLGAGVVAVAGGLSGARSDSRVAGLADRESRVAAAEADGTRRAEALAELDRRYAAKEREVADASARLAKLDDRRQALEREIAELIAPVAAPPSEREVEQAAALQPADPSPPDEAGDLPQRAASETASAERPEITAVAAQQLGGVTRVFIHVRSADPAARERARAVAEELRRRGVAVAEIRGVRYPVRKDAVRFFYDADRAAVGALQDAVRQASAPGDPAPQEQDFRTYRAPPQRGTLELWLS